MGFEAFVGDAFELWALYFTNRLCPCLMCLIHVISEWDGKCCWSWCEMWVVGVIILWYPWKIVVRYHTKHNNHIRYISLQYYP